MLRAHRSLAALGMTTLLTVRTSQIVAITPLQALTDTLAAIKKQLGLKD